MSEIQEPREAAPGSSSPEGRPDPKVVLDSELLAAFGHQLRNQLNAVLGAAGLLSEEAESPAQREIAALVQAGAEQASRLVDEVLDATAIQNGELVLALHPFNVRSSVETCLGLVADAAAHKRLDLSLQIAPDVPSVVIGDSKRLEQILLTLLHRGVDRTFRGGVGIELVADVQGFVVQLHFTIRDTGRGVPARILRAALDGAPGPNDRLEPGDRLVILSLSTTKQLVGLMHGALRVEQGGVEAGPDAGTSFDFTIETEALPAAVAPIPLTLEAMRVLVISSDAASRRVLALQAEQWGATAISTTPEQAVEVLQAGRPFDIALIEERSADADGMPISSSVRNLRRRDQLPIVLIAASAPGPGELRAADSAVIQAQLTKPVAPRTLHDVMLRVGAHNVSLAETEALNAESSPGALRVLVAEDNSLNQKLLRKLVASLGHPVEVVSTGLAAVAAVAQHPYDVVLMDVLMPEMDGLAAAEAICRRWPRGARPRLIALTGMAGPGDRERCLKAGYDDYLSKPVRRAELVEVFKSVPAARPPMEPSPGN
ncbi:MAG: response regulator [Candidatus Dormibacterales bacterium]